MSTKRVFKFEKERGTISKQGAMSEWLTLQLGTISNGEYALQLERVQRPRSNNQNALMWVWFTCIAQAWSEAVGRTITPQQVHDAYCQMFLPVTMPNGITVAGKTSGLNTEQMTDFLNRVQADAATEYGIRLLNPQDQYYTEWAKQYGY